jgi:hypothetical protein
VAVVVAVTIGLLRAFVRSKGPSRVAESIGVASTELRGFVTAAPTAIYSAFNGTYTTVHSVVNSSFNSFNTTFASMLSKNRTSPGRMPNANSTTSSSSYSSSLSKDLNKTRYVVASYLSLAASAFRNVTNLPIVSAAEALQPWRQHLPNALARVLWKGSQTLKNETGLEQTELDCTNYTNYVTYCTNYCTDYCMNNGMNGTNSTTSCMDNCTNSCTDNGTSCTNTSSKPVDASKSNTTLASAKPATETRPLWNQPQELLQSAVNMTAAAVSAAAAEAYQTSPKDVIDSINAKCVRLLEVMERNLWKLVGSIAALIAVFLFYFYSKSSEQRRKAAVSGSIILIMIIMNMPTPFCLIVCASMSPMGTA